MTSNIEQLLTLSATSFLKIRVDKEHMKPNTLTTSQKDLVWT